MSGSFTYRSPTTPAGPGWSENLGTDVVRLGLIDGLSTQAQLGSVDGSSIGIDDPDSDVGHDGDGIVGLKQFDWREGDCPLGQRVIWTGYIGQRTYRRGDPDRPSLIVGPNRWIDVGLSDINAFLSFRFLVDFGDSGDATFNRPAETDIERVQALLGIYYLSDTLFDGLVAASGGVNMDAVDYTGQKPIDVLNDCAQQSGRNFFVFYDEAGTYTPDAGDFGLFYDFNDEQVFPANNPDFAISNVLADCDQSSPGVFTGPTWPPLKDGQLVLDPMRVVSATQIQVGKTSVVRTMPTTAYKFAWRDQVATAPNLKTVTQAEARADRYNADQATEDARLTFSVELPPANVNDAIAGQFFPVSFSHLKTDAVDLRGPINVRCIRRTVKQTAKTQGFYTVEYECAVMKSRPSGGFHPQQQGVSFSGIPTLPRETTPGNVLIAVLCTEGNTSNFATEFRFLDNPPTSGSPPVPPYSSLQSAAWTQLGFSATDYSGMNLGGPCTGFSTTPYCTRGMAVGVYWRYVQPGEITVNPVAVSTELSHSDASVWLWELPTTVAPTAGDILISTQQATGTGSIALPSITGNVLGIFGFHLDDPSGHSTWALGGGSGVTDIRATDRNNYDGPFVSTYPPGGFNTPAVYIGQMPAGGVMSVDYDFVAVPNNYAHLNMVAVGVVLPPGITVPDIPYPSNQSA